MSMALKNSLMDSMESVKVVCVGDDAVGKTCLLISYTSLCNSTMNDFSEDYEPTVFYNHSANTVVDGRPVSLNLWDTAGQEEYDSITRGYYKGAGAAIIAFSTTDRASFDAVRQWHQKVKDECGEIPMVLVQNKVDLISQATMTAQEAEDIARSLRLKLYRMCVKQNMNIQQVFEDVGGEFVNRGGESGLGINSVTAMQTYTTGSGAAQPRAGATGNLDNQPGSQGDKAFKVGGPAGNAPGKPSSQRTGGKKRLFTQCAIL